MRIVNPGKQGSIEWIYWRKQGLGGSEIAAVMGKSPWNTALEIFEIKIGIREENISTHAMQRGIEYEPEAREHAEKMLVDKFSPICVENEEYPFMRCSLDGYSSKTKQLLEIKIPSEKNFNSYWSGLPDHYMFQVQWQLLVTGCDICNFCVYSPETKTSIVHLVKPDTEIMHDMIDAAKRFWSNLCIGIPPDAESDDFVLIDEPEALEMAKDYILADIDEKSSKKQKEYLKKRLCEFGDDGNFKCDKLIFTRTAPRVTYDMDAMRRDGIDVDKYKKINKDIGSYTVRIGK